MSCAVYVLVLMHAYYLTSQDASFPILYVLMAAIAVMLVMLKIYHSIQQLATSIITRAAKLLYRKKQLYITLIAARSVVQLPVLLGSLVGSYESTESLAGGLSHVRLAFFEQKGEAY